MTSFKCTHCGYTMQAESPPEQCPSCKAKCEFVDNSCYTPDCQDKKVDERIAKK
jgi:rubredoxin